MYNASENRIAKALQEDIENALSKIGLLFRVFSRAKSQHSIEKKLSRDPNKYSADGKKIQDLFGVRIALYFPDDLEITIRALKELFIYDEQSSTIDRPDGTSFSATRCNLIFRLPESLAAQSTMIRQRPQIDETFEVQIRTILSEGWHEVEHDLRYKCQEDWRDHRDLDRALNGIYATLETSDWSMMKLFEDLAYRHYKAAEWSQMLRTKFRLRSNGSISDEISVILNSDQNIAKELYRIKRYRILERLADRDISIPITPDNLVYLCNFFHLKSEQITAITPTPLLDIFEEHSSKKR